MSVNKCSNIWLTTLAVTSATGLQREREKSFGSTQITQRVMLWRARGAQWTVLIGWN